MAKNNKSASEFSFLSEFSKGINTAATYDSGEMCDMVNFRVLANGSIKKRSGYRAVFSSEKEIRALWSGYIDGSFVCYFLANRTIYTLDLKSGESTIRATIPTSTGKAQFFYLRDALYLIDGENIYRIRGSFATAMGGYVPLFGKDWDVGLPGQINEPLNLLTRRARITYKVGENVSAYLPTMYPVESIDALYKNGELVSASDYNFDTRFNTINLSGLASGDRLEANVTFSESDEDVRIREEILSSTCATVFGGINNSRLFLWNGSIKNKIYCATYVDNDSYAKSQERYGTSGQFYFIAGNDFTVGDGRYNVNAVVRHFDRLLILTDGDAWMADSSASGLEEFPLMSINSNIGCASLGGAVSADNDPISVGRYAIYRWNSNTDELNECNADIICTPINDLLDRQFFRNARVFCYKRQKEVWFFDPDDDGNIWIYNYESRVWYRFEGIRATEFFDSDGQLGFIDGYTFYLFDDTLYEDIDVIGASEGEYVVASAEAHTCDFESSKHKKLTELLCRASSPNASITATINTDRGEIIEIVLPTAQNKLSSKRLHSHRLSAFELKVTAFGACEQTIESLQIKAR